MKLADFDFRLALTPEVMADIACDNKDCPCQTPLLYGKHAITLTTHFTKIVKWSYGADTETPKARAYMRTILYAQIRARYFQWWQMARLQLGGY